MASGAGEAGGVLKSKPTASGSGKHAAEHMTKKPKDYAGSQVVMKRCAFGKAGRSSGDRVTQCPPKGETPKAQPGKG